MNKAIVILLAACGLSALVTNPAAAFGTRYPFCLQSDEWPGLSNCTFTSYEQCQASASARAASCMANPYFVGEQRAAADGCLPAPARPHAAAGARLSPLLSAVPAHSRYARLPGVHSAGT